VLGFECTGATRRVVNRCARSPSSRPRGKDSRAKDSRSPSSRPRYRGSSSHGRGGEQTRAALGDEPVRARRAASRCARPDNVRPPRCGRQQRRRANAMTLSEWWTEAQGARPADRDARIREPRRQQQQGEGCGQERKAPAQLRHEAAMGAARLICEIEPRDETSRLSCEIKLRDQAARSSCEIRRADERCSRATR
jgi:hypothetical protein